MHLGENMRYRAKPGQHICFKLGHAGQPCSTNRKIKTLAKLFGTAKYQRKNSKGN